MQAYYQGFVAEYEAKVSRGLITLTDTSLSVSSEGKAHDVIYASATLRGLVAMYTLS